MFEKVNQYHPDKVADRIAGAIIDLAYKREENPKCAVEVLTGHGYAYIIIESSVTFDHYDIEPIVNRIAGQQVTTRLISVPQDRHLAGNQQEKIRCGDNGIFKGLPVTREQRKLTDIAREITKKHPYDGKYIINGQMLTICQSHMTMAEATLIERDLKEKKGYNSIINPLGEWTGGIDTDSGATNRKLGSDMGDAVTGGGLHGKDLSKADVSINIACNLFAQRYGAEVTASCSIGDEDVTFQIARVRTIKIPYFDVVKEASEYIDEIGGFEAFAEYGLIR